MSGPHILVTFAVLEEAKPFLASLSPSVPAEILLTGIGPRRAQQTLRDRLRQSHPSLVIASGFAGGLNPALHAGDIACDTSAAPWLHAPLLALGAHPSRFHAAPQVLVTPKDKARAWQATGADAVDMESCVVRNTSAEHHVPCAIVRVISDAANEALPLDFNRCLDANGQLLWAQLAVHCLRHPSTLRGLLRLHRTTRTAARHLASILLALLDHAAPPVPTSAPPTSFGSHSD